MIAAVVPVKTLDRAKSRMFPDLDRATIERLAIAMLEDVLDALLQVPRIGRVGVVTPDPAVARAARDAGAVALPGDDPGLNPAVERAAATVAPGAGDAVLVVLGDVAGVRPREIEVLLDLVGERGVAVAASSDGGSSALLRRPRDVIPAGFGPGSAKVHRGLAERAGVPYHEIALPSLTVDLDEPGDLAAFVAGSGAGLRTRALLRELGLGDAP